MSVRTFILLLGLGTSASLYAATEFTNGQVPMDVVREFSGGTLYRSLPDNFPPLVLPSDLDLRLIASVEQSPYSQRVLLRSSHAREDLLQRLLAVLTVHGWVDVSTSMPQYLLQLCHDQYGQLTVTATARGGETAVEVRRSMLPPGITGFPRCAEQRSSSRESAMLYSFYLTQIPVLEVPPGTLATPPQSAFIRGGISSFYSAGGVEISRDGVIEVPDTTAADIYAHFAEQMQEQGWQVDSSGEGERSATSVWTKSVVAPLSTDVEMIATLAIVRGVDAFYSVNLKVQSPSTEGPALGIRGISGSSIVRDYVPIEFLGPPLNEPTLGIRGIPSGYAPF